MTITRVKDEKTGKPLFDRNGLAVWLVQISAGKTAGGARRRPTVTVHGSHREAEDAERALYSSARASSGDRTTLSAYCDELFTRLRKRGRAERTIDGYRKLLKRILPKFGDKRMDAITPVQLAKFMADLSETKHPHRAGALSGNTQLHYYRVLSLIFGEAVYDGVVVANPVKAVRPPRVEKHRARFHDPADLAAVWQALQTEPLLWRALIACTLLLGLRRSELVGLQWQDVDYARAAVQVRRGVSKRTGEDQTTGPLKTATSQRAIPIPAELAAILKSWQQEQGGDGEDFIAAEKTKDGPLRWIHLDWPTKWYRKFTTRHKLPAVNLHGLRHTYVTTLLASGMTLADIANLAGHATPAVTASVYSHATTGIHERATTALSAAINTQPGKPNGKPNGKTNARPPKNKHKSK